VRPGAERVAAGSRDSDLRVSAFRNRDGSRVVQVLNTGQSPERIAMQGLGAPPRTWWTPRTTSRRAGRESRAFPPARW
jgi:hypothetical protein